MFVSDYRPTKRVGVEELTGAINVFLDRIEEVDENGEAHREIYLGALIALELLRYNTFEYPRDFLAVFENRLQEMEG